MSRKVNLIIVGAMKAGTTSFVDMLSQHSDIFFSPIKEPNFFVHQLPKNIYSPSKYFSLETYLKQDFPKPLHIAKVNTIEDYEKLFSIAGQENYLAEASTVYLHAPESPKLIHDYNPNAKIIILTREPLKRAYSHFSMNVELGRETRTFEEAIQQDIRDFEENKLAIYSYVNMSCYKKTIETYRKLFGQENVLVTSLKHSKKDSNNFFSTIFDFLQIKNEDISLTSTNLSKSIKYPRLVSFLYKYGLKDLGSKLLPPLARKKIFNLLSQAKQDMIVSDETKEKFYAITTSQYNE